MILEFAIGNYRSFRDEQVLSFSKSRLTGRERGIINTRFTAGEHILPVAAIFGANASGKSNLVRGLKFLQNAVKSSVDGAGEEQRVPRTPFKLRHEAREEPTVAELIFMAGDNLYQYGFRCDDKRFLEEWLYAYPRNRKQVWFERNLQEFKFGQSLRGQNSVIADLTRTDSLFLSNSIKFKHEQLREVSDYISKIDINLQYAISGISIVSSFQKEEPDPRAIRFLSLLNTGIQSFERTKREPIPDEFKSKLQKFAKAVEEFAGQDFDTGVDEEKMDLRFFHEGADDDRILFDAEQESAGSRRLIILLHRAFKALDNGGVLVVDEIDASLHTKACQQIVELFLNEELNRLGAQLIFTTHDTNLLSSDLLRRDEVWLVEKNKMGESNLFPVAEFKLRKTDDLEKAYLDDRLGGVPTSFDLSWLKADG